MVRPAAELEHVDPVGPVGPVDGGVEAGAGVGKRFRGFDPAAVMLVPPSLGNVFLHAVELCQAAGMVSRGQVALDGTKVRANASRRQR